ncbi:DUF7287 family protein [Natronosalvus halobius]|uniref:DUF7287 family protein n=1 Tax=Natronosalvus halobius TaxID=2953746 RepID=UPI00209EE5AF|nr:hypothetical protein [Natronosalvus halobius]USZ70725.1 hypothetical protein NGM15_11495 [Natronosalvus halobius]
MTRRRPHTVSVSLDTRGQTTQDFAVGIGVFLLAVAFVFSFVPSLITPFSASTAPESAQADRIAGEIITKYSSGEANELDLAALQDADPDGLAEMGLRDTGSVRIDRINVTVVNATREPQFGVGNEYRGQSAGSATRIVTVSDPSHDCDPACRLVVRVW